MFLKNVVCKNCNKSELEIRVNLEQRDVVLICGGCGLTHTICTYSCDTTCISINF